MIVYAAGAAGAFGTLLVNAAIDHVHDSSQVQHVADEVYAAIAANL